MVDFDVIVHCGGGASIKYSLENSSEDYKKTVKGTLEVLEYIKNYNPNAYLIYPLPQLFRVNILINLERNTMKVNQFHSYGQA